MDRIDSAQSDSTQVDAVNHDDELENAVDRQPKENHRLVLEARQGETLEEFNRRRGTAKELAPAPATINRKSIRTATATASATPNRIVIASSDVRNEIGNCHDTISRGECIFDSIQFNATVRC